jgi:geranylgeranyl diphosphate synthase type I
MASEFERAAEEVKKIFEERGRKILEEVESSIISEEIECKEAKGALVHFASYFRDIVRPSLVSIACEAVGGEPLAGARLGKSLILLSGATDVHDDIIDKTLEKESRQTVVGKFGEDIALLAGDALIFIGFVELFEELNKLNIHPQRKLMIVHAIKNLYREMFDGEALELKFRLRTDIRSDEYLYVIGKKAADVEACMRVGAILGGGSEEDINNLGGYGRLLGMIVLARNDLEDLLDTHILNLRLRNESLPLPIIYALENEEKRGEILTILRKREVEKEEAEKLFRAVLYAGGIDKLKLLFESYVLEAKKKIINVPKSKALLTILEASVPKPLIYA